MPIHREKAVKSSFIKEKVTLFILKCSDKLGLFLFRALTNWVPNANANTILEFT